MSCGCTHSNPPPESRKGTGHIAIDRDALRRELSSSAEIADALPAKATGRPGVNVGIAWKFFTSSIYQSGDLPVLAVRELLQNSRDSLAAAIRHRQIRPEEARFDVTWDRVTHTLTADDNGQGMDERTILEKFLVIGESGKRGAGDSGEAAGGFGVAKAVILGASSTFRWEIVTRDNLAISKGGGGDVEVYDAPHRAGCRIVLHDVSDEFDSVWDRARQTYVGIEDRIRELLAANDLPGVRLTFNGVEVRPMFSRRGGSKIALDASWGNNVKASIKAYKRPPGDKGGAYYVRLDGLAQFRVPSSRGGLKVDVAVDLSTTVRPGQPGYPLNAARDAFQDAASWAFADLVEQVEQENESTGRNSDEDEVFDPDSDDADARAGAAELGAMVADAFADAELQRALADAAGGIMDYYAERLKHASTEEPVASLAPRGSKATGEADESEREAVLPPGFRAAASRGGIEDDIAAPSAVGAMATIRAFLQGADEAAAGQGGGGAGVSWEARRDRGIFGPAVELALERVERGDADTATVATIEQAIERAADTAMAPGGGGLLQVAAVPRVVAALEAASGQKARPSNPFGKHAGLRISRKAYDRQKAYRFKKNYGRWLPYLVAWDSVLRLVAAEARIRKRFKPGFVLDDNLLGLTTRTDRGTTVIYIQPDKLAQVAKAHRERPIALAAYLHGIACHELTHADAGRTHANGHDERFVVAREDLGAATAHLLPAIAVLVTKVLRLPERESDEARKIARLERQVVDLREGAKEARRSLAAVTRERDRLAATASSPTPRLAPTHGGSRAERLLDVAVGALWAAPPPGIEPAYVEGFVARNRGTLLGIVRGAFGQG
ncbi:MAG: hypothetical protein Q8P41_18265 [Pseudomonadota bacterium]|nr:hypothetical protein [Pseudomonadota bacterium]